MECLESPDDTLKRETLELLCKMTNQDNIEVITEKLMVHLKVSTDVYFKKEMVNKVFLNLYRSFNWLKDSHLLKNGFSWTLIICFNIQVSILIKKY